jgi:hypothetical protein
MDAFLGSKDYREDIHADPEYFQSWGGLQNITQKQNTRI